MTAPVAGELGDIKFGADGAVTLYTGSHDHGQGHWTTFAQVLSAELGIPFEKITIRQTDTDELRAGSGTGGQLASRPVAGLLRQVIARDCARKPAQPWLQPMQGRRSSSLPSMASRTRSPIAACDSDSFV